MGFFASVFGGTRSQISGPTAPMAVAMAVIITSHSSNLSEALIVVMMGGLLQGHEWTHCNRSGRLSRGSGVNGEPAPCAESSLLFARQLRLFLL